MSSVSVSARAKLNLFLAVTGRRPDGFHELVSVAAQLDWGDTLRATLAPQFSLQCTDAGVPVDENNLVLKAARLFAEAANWKGGAAFVLEKRIPAGAGLGGGSSDGVATLLALNQLVDAPHKLSVRTIEALAAQLGSDCPLFLREDGVIMRGRGERLEPLPAAALARLRGRRVLVFKPGFPVSTSWAYAQLAARAPAGYLDSEDAERRLRRWIECSDAPVEELLENNMEPPVFAKFVALPVLLEQLHQQFGLKARMSGSGSACFAFLRDDTDPAKIVTAIREAWGQSAFVLETRLA